uniref:Uncharacterized protein n=1 Tax=Spongospora subterranea TaxID=70186 RepID=A0A0H5R5P7_9EUKA|eukprot:CRZ03519.1 hypothetical protein [Spongospora subterranea]
MRPTRISDRYRTLMQNQLEDMNNPLERDSTTIAESLLLNGLLDVKYQHVIKAGQVALGKVKVDRAWKIIIEHETEIVLNLVQDRKSKATIKNALHELSSAADGLHGNVK